MTAMLALAALLAAAGHAPARPTKPKPRPPAFAATATCRACPKPPCTRPCLPALPGDEGPGALRAYSGEACPTLTTGWNRGFGYNHRDLLLKVPKATNGPFAVVFFWPAGGTAESIAPVLADYFDAAGYVLVIPDPGSKYPLVWSMDDKGADDDVRFFDDVLACLDAQLPLDRRRIHSAGYSTGAVFSAYLATHRADVLASFVSYSGGDQLPSGERFIAASPRHVPGLLYHGGAEDSLWAGRKPTLSLAEHMRTNGQQALVCDHGRGHVVGASTRDMWTFLLAHPFGAAASADKGTAFAGCTDR